MPTDASHEFQSVLSACMEQFLHEKHACGCAYQEQARILRQFDMANRSLLWMVIGNGSVFYHCDREEVAPLEREEPFLRRPKRASRQSTLNHS
jgi:hypothetical protein